MAVRIENPKVYYYSRVFAFKKAPPKIDKRSQKKPKEDRNVSVFVSIRFQMF